MQTQYSSSHFCWPYQAAWIVACFGFLLSQSSSLHAQEANWIWSPEYPREQASAGDCYFRKAFLIKEVESAQITMTADDRYELYINGRKIGEGRSIKQMEQFDIKPLLQRGKNVIAIRATNVADGPAAVAARVFIKQTNEPWKSYSTDASWRTTIEPLSQWQATNFNDARWKPAAVFGQLGSTAPWDRREEVSEPEKSESERFTVSPEFAVKEIMDGDSVGSLINMAFNEFGHIIASQEGGPLLLIYDSDKDGVVDKTREYCTLVKNIQGILPLNGEVFVTGFGPEGEGIYRLVDKDRNGSLEEAHKVIGFTGQPGEHGAHGLTLGPDGRIYCVLGNHVQYDKNFSPNSPLKTVYEGDLIRPKFEDPGGHARGIKAPGGTIIRLDPEGKEVELVAGGLRNAFDLTFTPEGRLLVHDSDMESDEGSAWYRPCSLYEIVDGGEYGWRSGWSKWPSAYFDRLPPLLETGRGSPTGSCIYNHIMYPQRYHDNLFLADWSQGKILSVKFDADGQVKSEVFLQGQPLNVTDLAVGLDGCLYFCTGGRGTRGGIYQVKWRGEVPKSVTDLGTGITKAIRQPQLDAAWSRQEIAALKREFGKSWSESLAGVAFSENNPAKYRMRALELMQLFGPTPTPEVMLELASMENERIRAYAAQLMGLNRDSDTVGDRLTQLLGDPDESVQRAAIEAIVRSGRTVDVDALIPLLASNDRFISFSARRVLERIPTEQWQEKLLKNSRQRVQLQAGLALMVVDPSQDNARQVLTMVVTMLQGFISDRNFGDALRLSQLAFHRSNLPPDAVPEVCEALTAEYPVGEPTLNRELFRILTYINAESVVPAAIIYLQTDAPIEDRSFIAMHLSLFKHQWTAAERHAVIKFFEETQSVNAGSSVPLYAMNATRDFCKDLPLEEARIFVSEGAKWPNAALVSLFQFPEKLNDSDLQTLKTLDSIIDQKGYEAEQYKRLRTGIVAMLAMQQDESSAAYLREVWIRSPERRQAIALGLAQKPDGENWDYLIRSLPVLESYAIEEVMESLCKVPAATDDPIALREVILHGLRMHQNGEPVQPATKLLSYWTGLKFADSDGDNPMEAWQTWFAATYPSTPEAVLPDQENSSNWNVETLTEYFRTKEGRFGVSMKGKAMFAAAQCSSCHKVGPDGSSLGPDLTSVASRFTLKETLESILYPSHVISSQYQTQRVLTLDGKVLNGIVTEGADGNYTVRGSDLSEVVIAQQDIEQIEPSKVSLMPGGLLDDLTAADIRDMMTYLGYVPEQYETESERVQTATTKSNEVR